MKTASPAPGKIPLSWVEPYDDFCLYAEDLGFSFHERMPRWPATTPVMVVAIAYLDKPTAFYLKRLKMRAYKRRLKLAARGTTLRQMPIRDLAGMYKLTLSDIDTAKYFRNAHRYTR